MLRILVISLLLLVAALMLMPRGGELVPAPEVATLLPEPRPLPDVSFTDKNGQRFATEDLAGEYTLLFFGFTNCPDICPLTLQVLAAAKARIESTAPGAIPRVVFVSVDPQRDNPDRIRDYLANFDPDFLGITAADEVLAPLLETLGVVVHKDEQDGEYYNVVHNGTVYVLDASGRWIGLFGGSKHEASQIASDFLRIRSRSSLASAR